MRIGEIVREGEREVPGWEPSRKPQPEPPPAAREPEETPKKAPA
jgi:hypothetical protein